MPYEGMARQVLLAKTTEKRFRDHPRPSLSDYISDLAWSRLGVEPEFWTFMFLYAFNTFG